MQNVNYIYYLTEKLRNNIYECKLLKNKYIKLGVYKLIIYFSGII